MDQHLIKSHFYCPFAPSFDVSLSLTGWFSLVKFAILLVTMIDSISISYPEMSSKCKYDGNVGNSNKHLEPVGCFSSVYAAFWKIML